ncbi:uncharacterized protein LOC128986576 [Macrosteles quadrilineatus]|uniref:uncharacterized protein LOC128986576 n=1 Tax=Macrosteles quadrilineatus TaxID=74068 RepID=UPI0023E22BE7|nr:uncharacterized protein LOC128986576 [Macrosteles quadrilineatus]
MVVLLLLCFTSLLSFAASDTFGLNDELATRYLEEQSIDLLKEEIAKIITPASVKVDIHKYETNKQILFDVRNIQLTHDKTVKIKDIQETGESVNEIKYNLKMDADGTINKFSREGNTEEKNHMEFEASQVVFSVYSLPGSFGECSVKVKDAKFTFGNPNGVTEDVWNTYKSLMGDNLEDKIKKSMQTALGDNTSWICGNIPTRFTV